jgi:hypothetical protein
MRRRGLSPGEVDDAIHLYNLGWPLARVGQRLGADHTTVLTKLRERGVPTRDPTDNHGHEQTDPNSSRVQFARLVDQEDVTSLHIEGARRGAGGFLGSVHQAQTQGCR